MALCHNCDEARDFYEGNGVQKEYEVTFEYYRKEDVSVAFWDDETLLWGDIPDSEWVWQHETQIKFNTAPAFGQKFIIYRCTDLEPLPAEFYPGTPIKAQDLNDNFFVLKSAIEETRCAVSRNDQKAEDKYWDKVEDTITKEQQINGSADALIDDEHIFTAAASAARHDSYVQDDTPPTIPYEQPGKIWNDTGDANQYFWDPAVGTWVSFSRSGPPGPQGDYGPPGKIIVGDTPPTEYPAIGTNQARSLESGDQWFDSYNVLLYTYYIDNYGPGQWVSVSKTGPQGEPGEKGETGGIEEAPTDGQTYGRQGSTESWIPVAEVFTATKPIKYEDNVISLDLLTIPNVP